MLANSILESHERRGGADILCSETLFSHNSVTFFPYRHNGSVMADVQNVRFVSRPYL